MVFEEALIEGSQFYEESDRSLEDQIRKVFPDEKSSVGISELKELIHMFDTNKDKKVTRKELFDLFMANKNKVGLFFLP